MKFPVMYSGHLGDQSASLGAQKNAFQALFFSVVFQQRICSSSDQWFHNASNYLEMT